MNLIVGTAGHIDHGKSSLVEALTGIHPDRLKEEKERGITIDLGFANLRLGKETQIGFVDVPGHERFIKNMLAGVSGIDAVLLVVAADESIMPQTREHFEICELLNIKTGLVAITKSDLVDTELVDLVRLEVQEFVEGSFLQGAPIVPVSVKSGSGLNALKASLLRICEFAPIRDLRSVPRLPVDRCFTLHGFGTVVTGTLLGGVLRKEDEVEIYPAGIKTRVRGLQVHSEPVDQALAGQRTAINLANVEVRQIHRGMEVSVPGRFHPISILDAKIELLSSSPIRLARKTQVRFHLGTAELLATLKPLAGKEIQPGEKGFARIQLERSILTIPGDRFIFRRLSPMVTLGGGVVLDVEPVKSRSRIEVVESLRSIESLAPHELIGCLAERNGLRGLDESQMLSRTMADRQTLRSTVNQLVNDNRLRLVCEEPCLVMDTGCFTKLIDSIVRGLEDFLHQNPLRMGIPREQIYSSGFKSCHPLVFRAALDQLAIENRIAMDGDSLRLPGRTVVLQEAESTAKTQIEQAFQQAGWRVPSVDEVLATVAVPKEQSRKLVTLLIREKQLVRVSEQLTFHSESIQRLKERLSDYKKESSQIDVGKFKELTGISRKYAIPLLEFLDKQQVTRRVGDHRVIL